MVKAPFFLPLVLVDISDMTSTGGFGLLTKSYFAGYLTDFKENSFVYRTKGLLMGYIEHIHLIFNF